MSQEAAAAAAAAAAAEVQPVAAAAIAQPAPAAVDPVAPAAGEQPSPAPVPAVPDQQQPAHAQQRPKKRRKPTPLRYSEQNLHPAGSVAAYAVPLLAAFGEPAEGSELRKWFKRLLEFAGVLRPRIDSEGNMRDRDRGCGMFTGSGSMVLSGSHTVSGGGGCSIDGIRNNPTWQLDGEEFELGGQLIKVCVTKTKTNIELSATAWIPEQRNAAKARLHNLLHIVLAAGLLVLYGQHVQKVVASVPGLQECMDEAANPAAGQQHDAESCYAQDLE